MSEFVLKFEKLTELAARVLVLIEFAVKASVVIPSTVIVDDTAELPFTNTLSKVVSYLKSRKFSSSSPYVRALPFVSLKVIVI